MLGHSEMIVTCGALQVDHIVTVLRHRDNVGNSVDGVFESWTGHQTLITGGQEAVFPR